MRLSTEWSLIDWQKPLLYIGLSIGNRVLDLMTAPDSDLLAATCSSITFPDQKNRRKGEMVAQGTTGHLHACPTRALARRLIYLRTHGGTLDTPLCSYKLGRRWAQVTSAMVTAMLRMSVAVLPDTGLKPTDIESRSLRSGGAMALLCGRVDKAVIQLVGRWRSDAMFEYLHASVLPITHNLAATMFTHGNYVLPPGSDNPSEVQTLLDSHPPENYPGLDLLDDDSDEDE